MKMTRNNGNRNKRFVMAALVSAALTVALFCATASLFPRGALPVAAGAAIAEQNSQPSESADKLQIVATIFPAFDFARVLTGDAADVFMLLPPGGDSHSYEPTPQDMISIQNADLFIYTGGESDAWIERILASLGQNAPQTFRMMDCVTALYEERSASMEDEAHDHAEEGDHAEEADHEEMDEHVWTSPKNAKRIVSALQETLSAVAPDRAALFAGNAEAYQGELDALDKTFEEIVANGKRRLIVFGDRFPFRYFAAAYGLHYDAAFPGCSEDSEPSVKTVMGLVQAIEREQVPAVFYIEFSSRKTADIIAEETGAKELLFHSCHTVSAEELEAGASYLSLMRLNADALREALN